MPAILAPLIGLGVLVGLPVFVAAPALVAGLMATGRLRYREWAAPLAIVMACALAAIEGDYLYNVVHWTDGRPFDGSTAMLSVVLFASPAVVLAVIFRRSVYRRRWAVSAGLLVVGTVAAIVAEYRSRARRDVEDQRRLEAQVVAPSSSAFLPASRERTGPDGSRFLYGHVLPGVPVTLLSNPFGGRFETAMCPAVATTYVPKNPDPAVVSDRTLLGDAGSCAPMREYSFAAIGRHATRFVAVPFAATNEPVDARMFSSPRVTEGWRAGEIPLSGMDIASARWQAATGLHGEKVFVVTASPFKAAPSIDPCTAPGLVLSVGDPSSIQVALPPCTLA